MLLIIHLHTICALHFQGHIHCFGHFSVQISSAFLSIILLMIIQGKVIPRTLEITSLLGGPILATIVILLLTISDLSKENKDDKTNTHTDGTDKNMNISAIVVNVVSLFVTATSLALIHR